MAYDSEKRPIGGDIRRIDARAKVTGQARYVEDIDMPSLVYAKVLRSPHFHARLLSINSEAAAKLPGVIRIISADDIPGVNGFPGYSRDEPLLTPVGDTVRMKGAPVALVIASTPEIAQAGLQAIETVYDPLPHTFDCHEALDDTASPIYEGGNLLNTHEVVHGDLDAAFEGSDVIIEATYQTAFQEHSTLERESALGYLDDGGRVTVQGTTHEPHWQQQWIADMLSLDPERVRFIAPAMGGSFGGKQDPWPNLAAGLAAYLAGKPVQLVFSRGESFDASPKRHPYELKYNIGATSAGHLTGMRVRIDQNTGGYDADGYYIPEYAVVASGGAYRWGAVDNRAQSIYTNAPKCGQFRGFGTPQSTFALECTLDEMIETLDEDPLAFRLKNMITQASNTFLGYPIAESLGYREVLEALRPRYQEFQEGAAAFNSDAGNAPYLKGVGVAGMWYRFGKSGSLRIEAHAELSPEGHFVIYCSAPDYGQGTSTVMAQLGAETLGVSRDQIRLVNADTALTPDSGVQGASRATYWVGNAVCQAAQNLQIEIIAAAAELLDHDPAGLVLTEHAVESQLDPAKSISLEDIAEALDAMGKSRKVLGVFDPSPMFPEKTRPLYTPHFTTGAHLAEVIVDLDTGGVQVTRFVAAHDVGRAINRQGAEGQIEGSILMGIGSALYEEYVPGVTTGFVNYILPMIGEMPEMEAILVEVPGLQGPFGAKGLGETAMLASTPAVINAVSRAIGTRIRKIPATPERVLKAINQE
ncbi:MAG: xanthine dehydrogenase family protein molybdopterin-binding subunit [Anaerolineales bacterium]|nr:xanthine dehydrogenase family protein molybdopterin-binding subunit [Anaerolineales bacterium]